VDEVVRSAADEREGLHVGVGHLVGYAHLVLLTGHRLRLVWIAERLLNSWLRVEQSSRAIVTHSCKLIDCIIIYRTTFLPQGKWTTHIFEHNIAL
jgi:hypothetical protein